ncbi:MAG: pyruvate:ferredoxin (flavodoxin) oxidoreductase, partial [Puniceicoccales bacterium]|nr:pyruvate:ferredoxin (flavodoxin) oxidoreductase [Puniceicoccales bacterium]
MAEEVESGRQITDANEAVASVAFRLAEMVVIYPITPSSPMAEFCDEWAAAGKTNLWGETPSITEMQSEAGVAGAVHGALQCGSLVTTFTASQGLLLMIPNMYKIAGQLIPFCMHVTARSIATHALSIFGDHSDVMACRGTGFAMFVSNSVQEAHDFALLATAVSYESRVPFLHFFDGFRTSHEVNSYDLIGDEILEKMLSPLALEAFRLRALNPDMPVIRGTAQNPDVFFQGRERVNEFYNAVPALLQKSMDRFAALTGRRYKLYEYVGDSNAEVVFVAMGSGAETVEETIMDLNGRGARLGLLKVRLYRPFSAELFSANLPRTTQTLIVLDRTKEPGSLGEPLYLDVVGAIAEARTDGFLPANFLPAVHGGRYGLGSKEFSPAMVKGIVDAAASGKLRRHFTVGINDDITHISVPYDESYSLPAVDGEFSALFYGLGADGTVGANKNTIKIIGHETGNFAQAYFVYDSKKSGGMTVSHLRFGPKPIRAPYLIEKAQFIGCHQFEFLKKFDILERAASGGVFLLNAPHGPEEIQRHLRRSCLEKILKLNLQFYIIDAYKVATASGMERRINTIMQTCFFAISGILPRERAIAAIKKSIEKTYAKKGQAVVDKNFACVDQTLANLHRVTLDPSQLSEEEPSSCCHCCRCPMSQFVKDVTIPLLKGCGETLPVSALPVDGTWPTDTVKYEKRNIAQEVPQWDSELCIQCNRCALVCPHAAIRAKFYPAESLENAPEHFQSVEFRSRENPGCRYSVQVSPEDCTGCGLCVEVCPARSRNEGGKKALSLVPRTDVVDVERENFKFFGQLPQPPLEKLSNDVKGSQFRQPLFEFSGACAGCGETPYVKLLTQLFGDHLIIANATGCSSIYGGNLPTTPYCKNLEG